MLIPWRVHLVLFFHVASCFIFPKHFHSFSSLPGVMCRVCRSKHHHQVYGHFNQEREDAEWMMNARNSWLERKKSAIFWRNIIAISPSNMNIDVYHFKIFPSCVNRMFWATHRGHDGQTAKRHSYPGRCRVEKQFCNRRATAHAADPRSHERKKKGAKKKEVRFLGWGGLSGRVRFEVSSVGCVYGWVYGDFLDSF